MTVRTRHVAEVLAERLAPTRSVVAEFTLAGTSLRQRTAEAADDERLRRSLAKRWVASPTVAAP